jgi:hypothetical protein
MKVSKQYYGPGSTSGPYKKDKRLTNKGSDYDLTPYMRISTKKLSIPPNKSRVIKLLISKPKAGLAPDAYQGFLRFATVPPKVHKNNKKVDSGSLGIQINMVFNQNSGVTGFVGKGYPSNATYQCKRQNDHLDFLVKNPSPWLVKFNMSAVSKSGKVLQKKVSFTPLAPYSEGTRYIALNEVTPDEVQKLTWKMDGKVYKAVCQ